MKKPEDKIFFEGFVLRDFMQRWKLHVAKGFQITYIKMSSRGWKIKIPGSFEQDPVLYPTHLHFPFSLTHIGDGTIIVTPAVKDAGFPQMAFNQRK